MDYWRTITGSGPFLFSEPSHWEFSTDGESWGTTETSPASTLDSNYLIRTNKAIFDVGGTSEGSPFEIGTLTIAKNAILTSVAGTDADHNSPGASYGSDWYYIKVSNYVDNNRQGDAGGLISADAGFNGNGQDATGTAHTGVHGEDGAAGGAGSNLYVIIDGVATVGIIENGRSTGDENSLTSDGSNWDFTVLEEGATVNLDIHATTGSFKLIYNSGISSNIGADISQSAMGSALNNFIGDIYSVTKTTGLGTNVYQVWKLSINAYGGTTDLYFGANPSQQTVNHNATANQIRDAYNAGLGITTTCVLNTNTTGTRAVQYITINNFGTGTWDLGDATGLAWDIIPDDLSSALGSHYAIASVTGSGANYVITFANNEPFYELSVNQDDGDITSTFTEGTFNHRAYTITSSVYGLYPNVTNDDANLLGGDSIPTTYITGSSVYHRYHIIKNNHGWEPDFDIYLNSTSDTIELNDKDDGVEGHDDTANGGSGYIGITASGDIVFRPTDSSVVIGGGSGGGSFLGEKMNLIGVKRNEIYYLTFPMCDTDGSPLTNATVTAAGILDATAPFTPANSVVETGNGYYVLQLDASELNYDKVDITFSAASKPSTFCTLTTSTENLNVLTNLDATVSSRSTLIASDVTTELDANSTKLANLDATVSSRSTLIASDVTTELDANSTKLSHLQADYTSTQVDQIAQAASESANVDMPISQVLARLQQKTLTYSGPQPELTEVELRQNCDYLNANGQQLIFIQSLQSPWPDLSGAVVVFHIARNDEINENGTVTLDKGGNVDVATGDSKQVSFQFTASETLALASGEGVYNYCITALTGAGRTELGQGKVTVKPQIGGEG